MKTFCVLLLAADRSECIEDVSSLVGEDASGSFGLLPNHERFMTVLGFGLARILRPQGWEYLGLPGGVLYFVDNECRISTRRYLRDTDVTRLARSLSRDMLEEEEALAETRRKLRQLETEMLKSLAELGRE